MSCKECVENYEVTYIHIGSRNIKIVGCRKHLDEFITKVRSQPALLEACKAEERARAYLGSTDVERRLFNKAASLREAAIAKAEPKQ